MSNPDFVFFLNNQATLYSQFPSKFILIRKESVVKVFDSYKAAFLYALHQGFDPGSYIIQESAKDLSEVAENFYSLNVSFK